jgi:prepilin-type N-terminal cleavage/methylation domain-containing protein
MRYQTSQSGFTLVETLVAISILLIVMIGPMTISTSAARSTSFSSEQVTAFFLAQEGAELSQKIRDDLLLQYFADADNNNQPDNPDPWSDFSSVNGTYQQCYASTGCGLTIGTNQTGTVSISDCNSSQTACTLSLNTSANNLRSRFTHTSGTNQATPFSRKILFQRVNADEVKVTSRVTWRTGALRQEQVVEVETRLFNIYGN